MAERRYAGIYGIKPWWQHRLKVLEGLLVRRQVHPDYITLAGLGCAGWLGAILAWSATWPWLAVLVGPLAFARLAVNALDGMVARRTGLARPWGEVFNEFSDRLADTAVLAGLALNRAVYAPLAWGVLVLVLLNSYLGTVSRAAGGPRQFGGLLGKADRMLYLGLFSPVALVVGPLAWNWLLAIFLVGMLLTLWQRFRWIYRSFNVSKG